MRKGMAVLIVVILVAIVGVFVLVSWQARLLVGIYRLQSVADGLAASYAGESEIYDWAARFLGAYPELFATPLVETPQTIKEGDLADGTRLTVVGRAGDSEEMLTVTAARQFATTRMELTREKTTNSESIAQETDVVFSLDCSASMGDPACAGCTATRMEKLKEALDNFVDTLAAEQGSEKVRLGMAVFSMKSDWLYTGYDGSGRPTTDSKPVKPGEDLTLAEIKTAVDLGFSSGGGAGGVNTGGRTVAASPACKNVLTETNIGAGLKFVHNYYAGDQSGRKQIEVLITDGVPNQRTPDQACPVSVFCPWDGAYCPGGAKRSQLGESWTCNKGSGGVCEAYGRDYLRCTLAPSDQTWSAEKLTRRKGSVAGWSLAEPVAAFEGSPTPVPTVGPSLTPTPRPTSTPRPPTPTWNPLTPTPTRRPTSTPRPTNTPTPTPPAFCNNLKIYPDIWPVASNMFYENLTGSSLSVDWRLSCRSGDDCGAADKSATGEVMAPYGKKSQGFGAVCAEWYFMARVSDNRCLWKSWTVLPNCPASPTATPGAGINYGIRDPNVDVYTVTVLDNPPADVTNILSQFSTQYYNSATADKLTEILQRVFQDILESLQRIRIRRVVPSPVR